MNKQLRPGFSMIELLMVITIGSVIMLGLYKTFSTIKVKINVRQTKNMLVSIKQALDQYQTEMKHLPANDNREKGLQALVTRPSKLNPGEEWTSSFLPSEPVDAWNQEIEYNCPPKKYKGQFKKYELISPGPNGDGENELVDGE